MRTSQITRRHHISYRQVDYWLRRMGMTPGRGVTRDVDPEMLVDLLELVELRRQYEQKVAAILANYPDGLDSYEAAHNKRSGESDW